MYNDFTDMPVWQKGKELVGQVYLIAEKLPKHELYAMSAQIRNAVLSIPANISEGFGRYHTKDKINFYYFSRGSSYELRSHLICAVEVNYFNSEEIKPVVTKYYEIEKELNQLIKALKF